MAFQATQLFFTIFQNQPDESSTLSQSPTLALQLNIMISQLTTRLHLNSSQFLRSNHILAILAADGMSCRIVWWSHCYFRCCCCCYLPQTALTILTCTPKLEGCRRQALKREQLEIYDPKAQLCAAFSIFSGSGQIVSHPSDRC